MTKQKQTPQDETPINETPVVDAVDAQVAELTTDLQRLRADFENYRKRVDIEKVQAKEAGASATVMKLLPVIDTIDRAVSHMPDELADNAWAQGIAGVQKNVDKLMGSLGVEKIDAASGTVFDPELHEAVQFEDDGMGETEVVVEELQAGYKLNGTVVRHAMVKVARQ